MAFGCFLGAIALVMTGGVVLVAIRLRFYRNVRTTNVWLIGLRPRFRNLGHRSSTLMNAKEIKLSTPPRLPLGRMEEQTIFFAPMANKSLLAFLEKASQDPALQEQLNGAMDADAVASVAHAAGCADVTADQVSSFLAEVASQQPASGDQELEGVTGGLSKGAKIGLGVGGALAGLAGAGAYAMNNLGATKSGNSVDVSLESGSEEDQWKGIINQIDPKLYKGVYVDEPYSFKQGNGK